MLKRRGLLGLAPSLRQHSVALISLVIAVLALTLNTERANRSEQQRTIRDASFRVLAELSQLQLLVDESHYASHLERPRPIAGWARVNYMRDLAMVIPAPVPQSLEQLFITWRQQVEPLGETGSAVAKQASLDANALISGDIERARRSVKQVLRQLD